MRESWGDAEKRCAFVLAVTLILVDRRPHAFEGTMTAIDEKNAGPLAVTLWHRRLAAGWLGHRADR